MSGRNLLRLYAASDAIAGGVALVMGNLAMGITFVVMAALLVLVSRGKSWAR